MAHYMLDSHVFNYVVDGKIDIATLRGKAIVATHVQRDEIFKTKDEAGRTALLAVFSELVPDTSSGSGVVPTESAVWGVSPWGKAKWDAEDNKFAEMRAELDAINKQKRNNAHDILIAETAVRNGWVLIASDGDLFTVVTKYGGACANVFALSAA